jgi:hypothetical protein
MKVLYDYQDNKTFTVSDDEFDYADRQIQEAYKLLKHLPNILPSIVFGNHSDWIYRSDEDYSELIKKRTKELDAILKNNLESS